MVDFDYLNFEDIEGNNLLMQSVAKNDLNSIKQLIDLKINLNHHNKKR